MNTESHSAFAYFSSLRRFPIIIAILSFTHNPHFPESLSLSVSLLFFTPTPINRPGQIDFTIHIIYLFRHSLRIDCLYCIYFYLHGTFSPEFNF